MLENLRGSTFVGMRSRSLKVAAVVAAAVLAVSCGSGSSGGAGATMLAVNAGATVTWSNKDTVNHTVDSDAVRVFNSGNLPAGKSYSHTFTSPGTYTYHCSVHPGMTGTVVVR